MLKYVKKYLTKTYDTTINANLTQALLWIHRKRAFSISKKFVDAITSLRLDNNRSTKHNSNQALGVKWQFVGVFALQWKFKGIFTMKKLNKLLERPKQFTSNKWLYEITAREALALGC